MSVHTAHTLHNTSQFFTNTDLTSKLKIQGCSSIIVAIPRTINYYTNILSSLKRNIILKVGDEDTFVERLVLVPMSHP
jgi:hypothetical protein